MNTFEMDPLADLDAFINKMNAEMSDLGQADPIDWNEFLVDPVDSDSEVMRLSGTQSPVSSNPLPKSTSFEQSLDVKNNMFDMLDLGLTPGIMHNVEDLPAYNAVNEAQFGDINSSELGLADFLAKFAPVESTSLATHAIPSGAITPSDALQQAYANLGWSNIDTLPISVQPSQLSLSPLSSPSLKRKDSDEVSVDAPAKRPRGRPPKARMDSGSSPLATPLVRANSIESDDAETAIKRTASGKPSTARPKSVVPEKYFKDGTAQQITGMSMEQILAFPTFEDLMKQVAPELQAGAAEFGERIAENRDKAKDAAKKSREERKAKVESLEKTIEGLEGKIQGMQGVLLALVAKGVLTRTDVQAFM